MYVVVVQKDVVSSAVTEQNRVSIVSLHLHGVKYSSRF